MCVASDYRFENHGSIFLCHPLTADAKANLDQACDGTEDFHMRWGDALIIDHRFANDIAQQLIEEGWIIE